MRYRLIFTFLFYLFFIVITKVTISVSFGNLNMYEMNDTVQTFNACTSRPDVCKCLVVKQLWITCQNVSQTHELPMYLANQSNVQL